MEWSDIAFKGHTPKDCEHRFNNHLKNVRRHRNLKEVVTDIEENIKRCPLKKPLNSYQIFIQDQLAHATTSGDFVCIFFIILLKIFLLLLLSQYS